MDVAARSRIAPLASLGLIAVGGADARAFLHAQLTSDIARLAPDRARYAGWCSAKGRLLATLLVLPHEDGFLLQLARDLVPGVMKRLAMFVLRAKVQLADASDQWMQYGVMCRAPAGLSEDLQIARTPDTMEVRIAADRSLVLSRQHLETNCAESDWRLEEIRAGRPLVTQATQDQFVPQMVNFEQLGGVDFQKGCYPGQEIVARAQYRGQVKRRMYHVRLRAPLQPGQALPGGEEAAGTVVDAVGTEALAVLPIDAVGQYEVIPLPYQH